MGEKSQMTGSRTQTRPGEESGRAARRRRLLIYGIPAVILAVVVAIAVGTSVFGRSDGRAAATGTVRAAAPRSTPLQTGDAVPDFSAPGLSGGRVTWSEARGTAPAALVIWASWCPHCQRELPVVAKVAPEFPGVRVVTVTTAIGAHPGPSPEAFIKSRGLALPVAVDDAGGAIAGALGVQSYPTVFWIGRDGHVRVVTEGERGEAAVRAAFQALSAG
jgi:peroxiredoxin